MSRSAATWTVLGAGSILPRAGYGPAGYALRPAPGAPVTLFDCGPGTVRALAQVGIGLWEIARVVVTHFHPDHTLDLFALAFARRNPHLASTCPELELIGPVGLTQLLEAGRGAYGRWVADERSRVREVALGERGAAELDVDSHQGGALRLACCRADHTPEALAWRATCADGASVTFSGDTGETERVSELARGTDLFVCECSFADDEAMAGHLTPTSAGRLAQSADCRRLLLTHFYPGLEPETARQRAARVFAGPIELARDGAVFALAEGT